MKVYYSIQDFTRLKNAVTTTGSFDGVHLGHRKIITRLIQSAKESQAESVILTFWPHPKTVLTPGAPLNLLSTLEEKIEEISRINPDHLLIIPFNKEFSNLSSQQFIEQILVSAIGTKKLVMGYDHRFGRNREGSFEYLLQHSRQFGFDVEEISREDLDDITVSSTNIRENLQQGKPEAAATLLGRPYSISGKVVEGDKLGRTIGYPTANISQENDFKLIPADGVYAVEVTWQGKNYQGMMNIGFRPTVNGKIRKLEVNIFDLDKDLYNESLKVSFLRYIREERKFASLEELKNQIAQDKRTIEDFFKQRS
jgi:riboflavin kinase / FMN adenylyltransferase